MVYYNRLLAGIFAAMLAAGYLYFLATARQRAEAAQDALLQGAPSETQPDPVKATT
ncbi:hypothetical protein U6115_18675 [Chromobacterium subtsugae]|nr:MULTISPECIES: hypothetical protein [Chromobacterium]WSE90885.1 hypothetical protein U6115_18675 [Chromobacterium subtsugae]WVH59258.1 hypothetical protein U6151_18705 [Chromobacterium subtsugae]